MICVKVTEEFSDRTFLERDPRLFVFLFFFFGQTVGLGLEP